MNADDNSDRDDASAAEPGTRRIGGSGDAVTVVGGALGAGTSRSQGSASGPPGRDAAEEASAIPPARPGGQRTAHTKAVVTICLAVIALAGWATAGVFLGLYLTKSSSNSSSSGSSAARAVRSTANQFANALFTFDPNTLNQNISQAQALSTPEYAGKLATIYSPDRIDAVKAAGGTSRADIKSVYVESVTGDSASVFVVLTDTIANNKNPTPNVDHVRMIVSLQRLGGAWRVADVQVLQAPAAAAEPAPDSTTSVPTSTG